MSADVKGVMEVELRADRFSGPARKVMSDMKNMDRQGQTTMSSLKRSSTEATGALGVLGSQGSASMRRLGASTAATGKQMQASAAQMNMAKTATAGMIGSVAGLGASFVALETSLSSIPKRLNAIEKAETALARVKDLIANKTVRVEKLELQLAKYRESGKKTAEEIAVVEQRIINTRTELTTASRDLSDKTEDLRLKHEDYNDTMKLFVTSIATTFITAGTTVVGLLTQMATATDMTTGAFVRAKLATLSQSAALKTLRIDLHGAKLALQGYSVTQTSIGTTSLIATTGVRRLSLAVKGLYLSLGPIGWAIIGVTAAFEVWQHNVGGVQQGVRWLLQELAKLWDYLKWIVPVVGAVDEAFKAWDPAGHAEAADGLAGAIAGIGEESGAAAEGAASLGEALGTLEEGGAGVAAGAQGAAAGLGTLNGAIRDTAAALPPLQQALHKFKERIYLGDTAQEWQRDILLITSEMAHAAGMVGRDSLDFRRAMQDLLPGIRSVHDEMVSLGQYDLAADLRSDIAAITGETAALNEMAAAADRATRSRTALGNAPPLADSPSGGDRSAASSGGSDGPRAPGPHSGDIRQAIRLGMTFGQDGRTILRNLQRRFPGSEAVGQDPGPRSGGGSRSGRSSRSRRRRRENRAREEEAERARMAEEERLAGMAMRERERRQAEAEARRRSELARVNAGRAAQNEAAVAEYAAILGESPDAVRALLATPDGRETLADRISYHAGRRPVTPLLPPADISEIQMAAMLS